MTLHSCVEYIWARWADVHTYTTHITSWEATAYFVPMLTAIVLLYIALSGPPLRCVYT